MAKQVDSSHPSAQASGVSEPQRLSGGKGPLKWPITGLQEHQPGSRKRKFPGKGNLQAWPAEPPNGICLGPPGGDGPQDFPEGRLGVGGPGAVPSWAGAKPEAKAALGKVYHPSPQMGLPLHLTQGSPDLRHRADRPQSCLSASLTSIAPRKQNQSSVSNGASGL